MREASYWEQRLPAEATAGSLDLPAEVDVLIVGAGFLGLWTANFLTAATPRPSSVLVVERDPFAYGASSRNAGFLTCGQVSEIAADTRESGEERALATMLARLRGIRLAMAQLGSDAEARRGGSMDFDPVTADKRALCERANAYLVEHGEAPAFEMRRGVLGGRDRETFFNRHDAGIDPVAMLRQLRARVTARGVRVVGGAVVRRIGGGRALVGGPDGAGAAGGGAREVGYRQAFLCTNAFAREIDPGSTVEPGRGQVIMTGPVDVAGVTDTLGFLRDGYDYFRLIDGRLLVGGGRDLFRDAERTTSLTTSPEVRAHLVDVARQVLGHAEFAVETSWSGIMGFLAGRHMTGDDSIRAIDDRTTALHACGGMGVALAPVVARAAAERFLR